MVKNYFLDKSYMDARETVKGALRKNKEAIALYREKRKEEKLQASQDSETQDIVEEQPVLGSTDAQDDDKMDSMFDNIVIAAILIVGNLSVICCSALHFLILGFITVGLYIVMGFLRLVDIIQNVFESKRCCSGCGAPIQNTIFCCPLCGEQHANLVSSEYGVLRKTCSCGAKLPVSPLNGRSRLPRVCQGCGIIIQPKQKDSQAEEVNGNHVEESAKESI